jgi:hypothetical protein
MGFDGRIPVLLTYMTTKDSCLVSVFSQMTGLERRGRRDGLQWRLDPHKAPAHE